MKILFYTRFEQNTGGDETYLNILKAYLLKNLESAEAHLCLSYDEKSEPRAKRVEKEWLATLKDKGLDGKVLSFKTNGCTLEQSVARVKSRYIEIGGRSKFIKIAEVVKTLDNHVTWYIKANSEYYIYSDKKTVKLELQPEKKSASLVERPCYAGRQKSTDKDKYPLFVINEFVNGNNTVFYYKNIEDQGKAFISPRTLKSIKPLFEKIRFPQLLEGSDLSKITTFIDYIPDELLITEEEYGRMKDTFVDTPLTNILKEKRSMWAGLKEVTKNLDLFVMAGWAHFQNEIAAAHVREELEIPDSCKLFLSSVPGMSINAAQFLTGLKDEQNYPNIYVLQTGIGQKASGGFPMLPTLTKESIEKEEFREQWISHIKEQYQKSIEKKGKGKEDNSHIDIKGKGKGEDSPRALMREKGEYKENHNQSLDLDSHFEKGEKGKDKLVVIYCSKDGPGTHGTEFLQHVSKKLKDEVKDYPVFLIGADTESREYKNWEQLCRLRQFKSWVAIERTQGPQSSQILMRGLGDAEFSMSTGAFSILEAKKLKIACAYLCPHHMEQLGDMLKNGHSSEIEAAFKQGQIALEALSRLPLVGFKDEKNLFDPQRAWSKKDSSEWKEKRSEFEEYLLESEKLEESNEDSHDDSNGQTVFFSTGL